MDYTPDPQRLQKPFKSNQIHICILGGGFGGLYTALSLQRFSLFKSNRCQITLIDRKDHLVFTPLLYELVTDELQAWEISPSYKKLLVNTNINFCQGLIKGVDLENRQVKWQADNGEGFEGNEQVLTYDYLVLAVGAQMRLEGVPGAATYAYCFRTVADAERLKERLRWLENSDREALLQGTRKLIQVAVVGGGPSGVELACKLADRLGRRGEVRLIERGNELLKTFSQYSRAAAGKALSKRRIIVDFDTSIEAVESDKITILSGNKIKHLPVDLVLWTVGTRAIDWIQKLPCPHNNWGQLLTLPTLQLVDYPEVLALGDLAEIQYNPQKQIPATAQVAYQQAACAAKNLDRAVRGKRLQNFHYLHLGEMLTLGKGAAVVSSFALKIDGWLASVIRQFVYLQRLPTLRHQLRVLRHWVGKWLRGRGR